MPEETCTHQHCVIRAEHDAQQKVIVKNIFWGSLFFVVVLTILGAWNIHRQHKRAWNNRRKYKK